MKLITICGPTSTGKTVLALQLAKKCNGELISADSRQIYTGMDIGTGKDVTLSQRSNETLQIVLKEKEYFLHPYVVDGINLWMYDVVRPDEEFSVSHYVHLCNLLLEKLYKEGKTPIVVGGTGLYIKGITEGIETIDIPRNEELRHELSHTVVFDLQKKLVQLSPDIQSKMNNSDWNNPRRLIRRIEVLLDTHTPSVHTPKLYDDVHKIGLTTDIDILENRISERIQQRIKQGVIEEVQRLLSQGYQWNLPSMNTFGYKEWKSYLQNPTEINKTKVVQEWIHDEYSYAKRQLIWFKKQPNIHWYDISKDSYQKIIDDVMLWYTANTHSYAKNN